MPRYCPECGSALRYDADSYPYCPADCDLDLDDELGHEGACCFDCTERRERGEYFGDACCCYAF